MKFLKFLSEEYVDLVSNFSGNKHGPVFINPTPREMQETSSEGGLDEIRFLLDRNNHDVYIFPGFVLHQDVCHEILNDEYDGNNRFISGTAKYVKQKKKMRMTGKWVYAPGFGRYAKFGTLGFDMIWNKLNWAQKFFSF
ncbi:MAG: hypothetical protein ACOC56_02695 [Atribacterota bacterium]